MFWRRSFVDPYTKLRIKKPKIWSNSSNFGLFIAKGEFLRQKLVFYCAFVHSFERSFALKCLIYYFAFAACGFGADVFDDDFTIFFFFQGR